MPQTVGAQGIRDLKVETDSGISGKIFRARWKHFQSKEETFSWLGGKIFGVRWKQNHATFYKRGKIFMALQQVYP